MLPPAEKLQNFFGVFLQFQIGVDIGWVDRQPTECGSVEAVELCADRRVSGRIVGVVARDKALEDVLNKLLDDE